MKKLISILFLLTLIPFLLVSADGITVLHKLSEEELGGIVTGVCFGEDGYCVYGDSAYMLYIGEDEENYTIDHPEIKKDMPHIRGVFYKDGRYMAIVYDSSVKRSYTISDLGGFDEHYGRLREHVYEKGAISPEGLLVTGQKKGVLWIGLLAEDGKIRWEKLGFASGFFFQNFCYYNGKYYTISRHHRLPRMLINVFGEDGKRLYGEEYDLAELLNNDRKSLLDAPVFSVDKEGIFVAGRILPMKTAPYGLTIRLDHEGKNPLVKKYEAVSNILSAYKADDYILLADDRARKQYFIDGDSISDTNKSALRMDGFAVDGDKRYIYGISIAGSVESFLATME